MDVEGWQVSSKDLSYISGVLNQQPQTQLVPWKCPAFRRELAGERNPVARLSRSFAAWNQNPAITSNAQYKIEKKSCGLHNSNQSACAQILGHPGLDRPF